ncbi:MAG: phosphinothricin acetyltransferase [Roseateles depolymerans]|uniref:Phosphinothricin acetyltransferase n=1 Tax=Roseateles depolymerans TaxID=76731 RepID=A0A2W5DHV6_9BURK|nr:MAG: phosphinothricin acetyltransferase [Roseateles depolymerans]
MGRITIRPVAAGDAAAFVSAARASRALHRPWVSAPQDNAAFERYLARFDGVVNHGFLVEAPDRLVGAIHLTNLVMGAFRSGYLGYYAFAGAEGQGLMTQGLKAVVRHAFQELGLHRVEANIQPANAASIALVQRCGFRLEGYSPRYLKIGGRWRDHERWARTRD